MEIILTNQVLNAASQTTLDLGGLITAMQSSGMSNDAIKTVLMNDLSSGGRIFGSFKNSLKNTIKNGVEYGSNQAQKNIYADTNVQRFRWITAGGKVCPDCLERHGQVEPMEYWETVGLPKSGFSICQTNCQCIVVPASYKGENLEEPLLRGKKVAAKISTDSVNRPKSFRDVTPSWELLEDAVIALKESTPGYQTLKSAVFDSKKTQLILAKDSLKNIIGALSYYMKDGDIWLNNIGSIKKGAGGELLKKLKGIALKQNATIYLTARVGVRAYWKRRGFKLVEGSSNKFYANPRDIKV
jgi:hypothetical protein